MNDNKVSAIVTSEQKTAVLAAAQAIKLNLPDLITLTKEQRVRMLKVGGSSVDFTTRIYDVATHNQQYLPGVFDMAEWKKDVEYYQALREISDVLTPLLEAIDDTLLEVGAEAYASGLAAYQYMKNNHVSGDLDNLLENVGKKFARKSGTPKAEPPSAN